MVQVLDEACLSDFTVRLGVFVDVGKSFAFSGVDVSIHTFVEDT